jgi:calcineurin-like phosphoesterase family protein
MDEAMIERWNAVVTPQDHVYHLGDVAIKIKDLRALAGKLNGHKRLLCGNHDVFHTKEYQKVGFEKVSAYRVFGDVVCSHIPIHERSLKQRWLGNIHGHIHEQPSFGPRYLNICVEQTNYAPISLEDAVARLRKQLPATIEAPPTDFTSNTVEDDYKKVLADEGEPDAVL